MSGGKLASWRPARAINRLYWNLVVSGVGCPFSPASGSAGMLNFQTIRSRPRVFQQLTGLTPAAFEALLAAFERAYEDDRQRRDRQRPRHANAAPVGAPRALSPHRLTSLPSCCSTSGTTPPR